MHRFVFVATCLFAAVSVSAEPCLLPDEQNLFLSPVIAPRAGATVPTNVAILVEDAPATLTLASATSGPVPYALEHLRVSGLAGVLRLVPEAPFAPGDTVTLTRDETVLLEAVVGDGPDTDPPKAPAATFAGPYSNGRCGAMVHVVVGSGGGDGGDDEDVILIATRGEPSFGDEAQVAALSMGSSLAVAGESASTETLQITAIDAAGNLSPSTAVEVSFPDTSPLGRVSTGDCGAGTVAPGFLLPLLALRQRRRR